MAKFKVGDKVKGTVGGIPTLWVGTIISIEFKDSMGREILYPFQLKEFDSDIRGLFTEDELRLLTEIEVALYES